MGQGGSGNGDTVEFVAVFAGVCLRADAIFQRCNGLELPRSGGGLETRSGPPPKLGKPQGFACRPPVLIVGRFYLNM
jgi:hypothetical protein